MSKSDKDILKECYKQYDESLVLQEMRYDILRIRDRVERQERFIRIMDMVAVAFMGIGLGLLIGGTFL